MGRCEERSFLRMIGVDVQICVGRMRKGRGLRRWGFVVLWFWCGREMVVQCWKFVGSVRCLTKTVINMRARQVIREVA